MTTKDAFQTKYKVALIGRSNVGKSSLINYILGRQIAKTSKHPGKTRKHDLFNYNKTIDLVDMPGYGYASVHGTKRAVWDEIMIGLFFKDPLFRHLLVLIDSSIPPMKIDQEFLTWLVENQVSFSIVFTKVDKATAKELASNIKDTTTFVNLLPSIYGVPRYFQVSAEKKKGAGEIIDFLNGMQFKQN
jgi:GTP-binding protein